MSTIARAETPEQRELARKQDELAAVRHRQRYLDDYGGNGVVWFAFSAVVLVVLVRGLDKVSWEIFVALIAPALGGFAILRLALYSYEKRILRLTEELARAPCAHGTVGAALDRSKCPTCAPCVHGVTGAACDKSKCLTCVEEELARAPCVHGIVGAAYHPSKCRTCVQEHEAAARKHAARLARIRLAEHLRSMDPKEFEYAVCELFRRMGYEVTQTPYSGDSGVDGFLRIYGRLAVLQCKRVTGSVGQPVLRDLFGTMHAEKADEAILVTTGTMSKQAREWAQGKPIRVIEFAELHQLVLRYFQGTEIAPESLTPHLSDSQTRDPVLTVTTGPLVHTAAPDRGPAEVVPSTGRASSVGDEDLRRWDAGDGRELHCGTPPATPTVQRTFAYAEDGREPHCGTTVSSPPPSVSRPATSRLSSSPTSTSIMPAAAPSATPPAGSAAPSPAPTTVSSAPKCVRCGADGAAVWCQADGTPRARPVCQRCHETAVRRAFRWHRADSRVKCWLGQAPGTADRAYHRHYHEDDEDDYDDEACVRSALHHAVRYSRRES